MQRRKYVQNKPDIQLDLGDTVKGSKANNV